MTIHTKKLSLVVAVLAVVSVPGLARAEYSRGCSIRSVAGEWLFATGIGRQMLEELFPPDKDLTALGTMTIYPDGSIAGAFDVTVQDTAFVPNVPYSGSIVVNRDCTGSVTFITGVGTERTDSIAIVEWNEILGMSQDPRNLWTYQMRRIRLSRGH